MAYFQRGVGRCESFIAHIFLMTITYCQIVQLYVHFLYVMTTDCSREYVRSFLYSYAIKHEMPGSGGLFVTGRTAIRSATRSIRGRSAGGRASRSIDRSAVARCLSSATSIAAVCQQTQVIITKH